MVHELAEGVGEVRQRLLVDRGDVLRRVGRIGLVVDDIGNKTRAWVLGKRRRIDAVDIALYSAGVRRTRSVPATPQLGLATLLPTSSMGR